MCHCRVRIFARNSREFMYRLTRLYGVVLNGGHDCTAVRQATARMHHSSAHSSARLALSEITI